MRLLEYVIDRYEMQMVVQYELERVGLTSDRQRYTDQYL